MKSIAVLALLGMASASVIQQKFLVPDMNAFDEVDTTQTLATMKSEGIDVKTI